MSKNKRFVLLMQQDGNLVLYKVDNSEVLWNSGTAGTNANYAWMWPDGTLRVRLLNGNWIFSTPKPPKVTKPYLFLQDDGNLVMYDSENVAGSMADSHWASNTITGPFAFTRKYF
jgi:hypothetical protein